MRASGVALRNALGLRGAMIAGFWNNKLNHGLKMYVVHNRTRPGMRSVQQCHDKRPGMRSVPQGHDKLEPKTKNVHGDHADGIACRVPAWLGAGKDVTMCGALRKAILPPCSFVSFRCMCV